MRLIAVLFTLTLSLPASSQLRRTDVRAIDDIMTGAVKAWGLPGAAIAVVHEGRIVFAKGYGTKEVGGTEPVTPETLFQVASTSKAFTATALAMLAGEKKLSWDDAVREHLEYFRLADFCADRDVTIRDLVSHRTGLQRHDELWDNTPFTREEVVRKIAHVGLAKPFRSAYQYQNIMFIAAGEIVGSASGQSWDDFVRSRIFAPLGMRKTVLTDAEWNASDHATGYFYDWKSGNITPQVPIETGTIGAGGGIKSNALDMAQWIRFQLAEGLFDGKQLVDAEALAETKTPHTVVRMTGLTLDANPETTLMSYGMGWVIQDYRGELLVSHAGALNGFRTHVDLLPGRKSGFVLMTNVSRGVSLIAIRNSLADLISGKPRRDWNAYYLMIDRKADEKDAADREERLAKRKSGTSPSLPLTAYAGEYASRAHGTATVKVAEDKLVLQWNRMEVPLEHFQYDVFIAGPEADYVEDVVFELDQEREIETMTVFDVEFERK